MVPRIPRLPLSLLGALLVAALALVAPATVAGAAEAAVDPGSVQVDPGDVDRNEVEGADVVGPVDGGASPMGVTALDVPGAVVALDPGHGGDASGAIGIGGFREEDVNWKISMATKRWLEERGVTVVMTHAEDETPDPTILERVRRAEAAGACVIVSQHNNAVDAPSGATIYIPWDCSFYNSAYTEGVLFARVLAPKFEQLGLPYLGTKVRLIDYDRSYDYPNGDVADYYGILRYARQRGITGLLIEHAFVDSEHDAALLRDDAFLEKLGVADAEAIYTRLESLYRTYCENHGIPYVSPSEGQIDAAAAGSVHRLYNPWSGEHLYTVDGEEAKGLVRSHWMYEGVEWVDPGAGDDVYRLFNPYTDEHLYTTDPLEYAMLGASGWRQEGVKLHTADADTEGAVAVSRLFNPHADQHLFTTSQAEYEQDQANGWIGEGIKLHGLAPVG